MKFEKGTQMSDDPAHEAFKWECRRKQIESLRIPWEGMGEMANQQRAEAAVQISTMMDEIEAWRQAMRKAERDMEELRAERDDARREACRWSAEAEGGTPEEHAQEQGWDSFREKA